MSDWCGLCGMNKKGGDDVHGAGICVSVCQKCNGPRTAPSGCECDVKALLSWKPKSKSSATTFHFTARSNL